MTTVMLQSEERTSANIQESEERMMTKLETVNTELKSDITEIKADITEIRADITEIKGDAEITRTGVNHLLGWAERAETMVKVPLYEKAE